MGRRGIPYRHVSPSAYAGDLRRPVRTHEPARLIDTLIVGAIVEARSCERFQALVPWLDPELAEFYQGLEASEARHFDIYLQLARQASLEKGGQAGGTDLEDRVSLFLDLESTLIQRPDPDLRFHSGIPV